MNFIMPLIILTIVITGCTTTTTEEKMNEELEQATFAGGCFWCIEAAFEEREGIYEVTSGYTGGEEKNPTYKEILAGTTKHYEAVTLKYDPKIVTYEKLLDIFIREINPTDTKGQFVDKGSQYQTVIFYHNTMQKEKAEMILKKITPKFDKPIATKVLPIKIFYEAEEYHQDYYKKRSIAYQTYKKGSGREAYTKETWKEEVIFALPKLTNLQKEVTEECGTEPPFQNAYWNNYKEGIYVDVTTGKALFSSADKFDSGTGWPSFTKPIGEIIEKEDTTLGMARIEIKSESSDNHLGHIFDDGPNNGLRYCINSASLLFIPKEEMKEKGYKEYLNLFG